MRRSRQTNGWREYLKMLPRRVENSSIAIFQGERPWAQAVADRILAEAQKQTHDLVIRRRHEVRVEAERIMATAIQEAERQKKECLAPAAAETPTQVQLNEATKRRAVKAIIRFACGISQEIRKPAAMAGLITKKWIILRLVFPRTAFGWWRRRRSIPSWYAIAWWNRVGKM